MDSLIIVPKHEPMCALSLHLNLK